MAHTVNLDCKTTHVDRNGQIPILLRISINGVHFYLNTKRKIFRKNYDSVNKKIKAGFTGYTSLDDFICKQKSKVIGILDDYVNRGETATKSKLKEAYLLDSGQLKSECFYAFAEKTMEWERIHSSISDHTLNNYKANLKKLRTYRKKLTIHDIDKPFLETYKAHILNTLNQAPNTAYHAMCFIRKYTKKLFDDGKIKPYPFAKFEVGKNFEGQREYLEPEELDTLYKLYESKNLLKIIKKAKSKHARDFKIGIKYQEVLRYFLVSCYCGLRHSDIKTLSKKDIKGNFIDKEMQKGRLERKKRIRIPLRAKLKSLLDLDSSTGLIFENPVMETSQTNKYLLDILREAGINKHITFHSARHTFAIISLIRGVSIVVISNVLGHSELTTTQRYAKVIDLFKDEEMNKWDDEVKDSQEINCPKCKNEVLKIDSRVLTLQYLPLKCKFCKTEFLHEIKHKKIKLKK